MPPPLLICPYFLPFSFITSLRFLYGWIYIECMRMQVSLGCGGILPPHKKKLLWEVSNVLKWRKKCPSWSAYFLPTFWAITFFRTFKKMRYYTSGPTRRPGIVLSGRRVSRGREKCRNVFSGERKTRFESFPFGRNYALTHLNICDSLPLAPMESAIIEDQAYPLDLYAGS